MNSGSKPWRLIFPITEEDKEKFSKITDEIIDLLYKKHKLSPIQCGVVLKFLQDSYDDTMSSLWETEQKEFLG